MILGSWKKYLLLKSIFCKWKSQLLGGGGEQAAGWNVLTRVWGHEVESGILANHRDEWVHGDEGNYEGYLRVRERNWGGCVELREEFSRFIGLVCRREEWIEVIRSLHPAARTSCSNSFLWTLPSGSCSVSLLIAWLPNYSCSYCLLFLEVRWRVCCCLENSKCWEWPLMAGEESQNEDHGWGSLLECLRALKWPRKMGGT